MTTTTTTINECIDQAVALMPEGRQKRRLERRLQNDRYRDAWAGELMDNLDRDPRIQSMGMLPAMLGAEEFTASTPFQIDTDKLRDLLDIIIEYAPKIIEIIMLLLKMFGAVLVVLTFSGAADAQVTCKDGTCVLRDGVRNVASGALRVATLPVVAIANARSSSCGCSNGESQRAVLHSTHSQAAWVASRSNDEHRHPLRSGIAAILHRGRVASQSLRSSRPVASLLCRTGQVTSNLVSAVRPAAIRARIRCRANR